MRSLLKSGLTQSHINYTTFHFMEIINENSFMEIINENSFMEIILWI